MERISGRQLNFIGMCYILSVTLLSLPAQIVGEAKQDAWASYLIAMGIIFLSLWMISRVTIRFPEKDLFDILVIRFRFVGRAIAVLYILFFFFILVRDFRMLVDGANILILPNTPLMVLGFLFLFTIAYSAKRGLEVLARLSELFLPLFISGLLIIPILTFREFEARFLLPVMEFGINSALKGSWLALPYIGELLALPFIFSNQTFRLRNGLVSLLLGTLFLIETVLLNLLVLGNHITSRFMYPNFELVRQIRMTDFLDRFDLIIISMWFPILIIKVGLNLYIVCHGLHRITKDVSVSTLSAPVALLALVCGFWFYENPIQVLNLNRSWPVIGILFQLLFPLLFLIFLRPRKGEKKSLPLKQS